MCSFPSAGCDTHGASGKGITVEGIPQGICQSVGAGPGGSSHAATCDDESLVGGELRSP